MIDAPAMHPAIEHIADGHKPIATIVRAAHRPTSTAFVTPDDRTQQVGFIVYPAGHSIPRHTHRPIERRILGTGEVLLVRKGSCFVDLYNDDATLIATRRLNLGDLLIINSGGHGFRMIEDTVLLEVKQGPYTGLDEKDRF